MSAAGGGPTVDADVLVTLATACRDARAPALRLHDTRRRPTSAGSSRIGWSTPGTVGTCSAWDRDRADWRTFRADRVRPHLPTGPRFTPREPPEDAARHVVRGAASRAWPYPARVRLHAPAGLVAGRITPAGGLLTPIDEATCILETGGDSMLNLVGYLTSLDVPFEVLEPPELRDLLRSLADRYRAATETNSLTPTCRGQKRRPMS